MRRGGCLIRGGGTGDDQDAAMHVQHVDGVPVQPGKDLGGDDLVGGPAGGPAAGQVDDVVHHRQQRVLIAHALISRPRLLLLDEPLANLDLRSGQEVVSLLEQLARMGEGTVQRIEVAHGIPLLMEVSETLAA